MRSECFSGWILILFPASEHRLQRTREKQIKLSQMKVRQRKKEKPYTGEKDTEQKAHAHLPGVRAAGAHVRTKSLQRL